jgi:MOSC domain-containing protein YiiM
MGLVDDEQADPSVHGGLSKAVYAYPLEHYDFWVRARAHAGVSGIDSTLPPGSMGENLTLRGLLETEVWVGDVLRFPSCALRVAQPREPCFKFNAALGFNTAVKSMAESGFCGFYLSVDEPGTISAGDRFEVMPGSRQMGIPELFQAKMFKHLR